MRLLHTSDWHLGRLFHKVDLLDEQARSIDRIVEIAVDQQVDAVLVAGDLFDRAIPPLGAVELLGEALARLRATGAVVVAISGNHDSATRIGAHDQLLLAAGVALRGDVRRLHEPVVLPGTDGGPPVAIYPVPYLDPPIAGRVLEIEAPDADGRRTRPTHHDVTARAMDLVRADAAERGPVRTVVVAHAFVAGGLTSESERELTVGNLDLVAIDAFTGIDHVALGHLHGRQVLADGRIAYSGTPLPYSFSEEGHTKGVRIVEVAADGSTSAEDVPVGVGRPLRTIRGPLEDLLADAALHDAEAARVRALLTDDHLPMGAMARLQERFPHAVELRHDPAHAPDAAAAAGRPADPERPPVELATAFWEEQVGQPPNDDELALLTEALDAAAREAEGAR